MLTSNKNLPILPALLQTAVLALLSASLPLAKTVNSAFLALTSDGSHRIILSNPTILQSESADSVHVLALTSHGDLLLAESEGCFSLQDWDAVYEAAKTTCCEDSKPDVDYSMQGDEFDGSGMMSFVKTVLQTKVATDLHWKD